MESNRGARRTFDMQQLDALSKGGKAYTDSKSGMFMVVPPGRAPAQWARADAALTPMANKQLYAAMLATGRERGQPDAGLKKNLAAGMQTLREMRVNSGKPPPTNEELMAGGIASMAAVLHALGPRTTEEGVALTQRTVSTLRPEAARTAGVTTHPTTAVVVAVKEQMEAAELDSRYSGELAKLAGETENRLKAANPEGWRDRKVSAGDIETTAKAVVAQFNDWAIGNERDRDPLARPDLHTLD